MIKPSSIEDVTLDRIKHHLQEECTKFTNSWNAKNPDQLLGEQELKRILSKIDNRSFLIEYGNQSLFCEAEKAKLTYVKHYAESDLFNRDYSISNLPIIHAAVIHYPPPEEYQDSRLELVRYLLKQDINVSATDEHGSTILHAAAMRIDHNNVLRMLLEEVPTLLNLTNKNEATALHCAVQNNNIEGVRLLLEHNADVHPLQSGASVLYMAVFNGNKEMATLLLDEGAMITPDIKTIIINDRNREAISYVKERIPNPNPQTITKYCLERPCCIIN